MERFIFLRSDLEIECSPEHEVVLRSPLFVHKVGKMPDSVIQAIEIMKAGNGKEDVLMRLVKDKDGLKGELKFLSLIDLFKQGGFLGLHLLSHSGLDARIIPMSHRFNYEAIEIVPDIRYQLSRFSYIRRENKMWLMECPRGLARLEFSNLTTLTLALSLAEGNSARQVGENFPQFSQEELVQLLALMISASVIHPLESPEAESLASWEFHDLLFHSRSRAGRHNYSYGSVICPEDSALPASREEFEGERFPLSIPDLEKLTSLSPSFYQVIEDRRSIRNYGNPPIDLRQLGEFLYRVSNLSEVIPAKNGDLSRKPFPSAGSLYELEFYTVINDCVGLEQGVFHYSSDAHELVRVCNMNAGVQRMISLSWLTATKKSNPQVLIIITARFKRVSLNYRSVSYALILKDVGVIYHHMYMVATAMKLAPCALGGGDSDLFAEVTGIDYYNESTVGEFLLGSR